MNKQIMETMRKKLKERLSENFTEIKDGNENLENIINYAGNYGFGYAMSVAKNRGIIITATVLGTTAIAFGVHKTIKYFKNRKNNKIENKTE